MLKASTLKKRRFFEYKSFYIFLFIVLESSILFSPVFKMGLQEWRQADVAAMARNFALESPDILRPRVDGRGNLTGIDGSEFPLYPYIVSLFYRITNTTWEGYAKILSILFGCYIMLLLFSLGKSYCNLDTKSIGIACFSCNMFLIGSKMIMPANLSLLLCLLGVYFFTQDIHYVKKRWWILTAVFIALGICTRPFMAFCALPILIKVIVDYINKKEINYRYCVLGIVILIPFGWWYFFWVPYLKETYHLNYFASQLSAGLFGELKNASFIEFLKTYPKAFLSFSTPTYWESNLPQSKYFFWRLYSHTKQIGWIVWPLFVIGFVYYRYPFGMKRLLIIIFLTTLISLYLISKNHSSTHPYYLYALVPVTILFVAGGISSLLRRNFKCIYVLFALLIIQTVNHFQVEFLKTHWYDWIKFRTEVNIRSKPTDLFVVFGSPIELYLINRKGWLVVSFGHLPQNLEKKITKESLKQYHLYYKQGAQWVVYWKEDRPIMHSISDWIAKLKPDLISTK